MELLDNSGGCHDDRKLRRFMVTGNITGGHLKTPAEADKESIQVFRQGSKFWRRKIHHVNHVNCMSVSIKAKNHTQPYHLDKPARLSFSCSLDLLLNERRGL